MTTLTETKSRATNDEIDEVHRKPKRCWVRAGNGTATGGTEWDEMKRNRHTHKHLKVTRIAMRNNLAMEKIQKSSHQKAKLGAAKWYGSKFEEGKQNQMIPERIKNIPKVLHLIFFFNN